MYLHMGLDKMVRARDVVGIFDLDTATLERDTRDFLTAAQRRNQVVSIGTELPKSFVVTQEAGGQRVYIGPLNAPTLGSRVRNALK